MIVKEGKDKEGNTLKLYIDVVEHFYRVIWFNPISGYNYLVLPVADAILAERLFEALLHVEEVQVD